MTLYSTVEFEPFSYDVRRCTINLDLVKTIEPYDVGIRGEFYELTRITFIDGTHIDSKASYDEIMEDIKKKFNG